MGEASPAGEPRVIGRYEILLPIAKGGMGTVYLARMRGIGGFSREVAIKVVHDQEQDDERAVAQAELLEEAKIAARLRHPNVVPVIDVGEDAGRAFIVMEYVEGDSLAGLARAANRTINEHLPLPIGLRIILDSLAGLHAAHELAAEDGTPLGLVHRDYSPQNILVGSDGIARLTDFGVAKLVERTSSTQSGIVKGKIRYLSPEQARGGKLDRRCDVWSAGVVLWELLARRKLWVADTDAAVLLRIVTETAPLLSEVTPDVPPAIEAIVASALQPNRENRPASALALRQALSRAVKDAGLNADHDEVAAHVARIAGPAISARRSKIPASGSSAPLPKPPLGGRGRDALISDTELSPLPLPPAPAEPDTTSAAASLVKSEAPKPPRTHVADKPPYTPLVIAACVFMVVAGGALIVFSLTRHREPPIDPTLAAASTAPAAPSETGSVVELPAAPETAGKKTRAVTFTANWDVKVLRYGVYSVNVAPPRRVVAILIPEGDDLKVEALSTDGRTATGQLDAKGNAVTLSFPPRPAAPKPTDDLAPSPYKKTP